eukprot:scaffold6625_cov117-Skeletonema_dohrnii-CCMP3373.AAC.4
MRIKQKDDKALGLFRNTIRLNLVCLFIGNKRLALSLVISNVRGNRIGSPVPASMFTNKSDLWVYQFGWLPSAILFFASFLKEGWRLADGKQIASSNRLHVINETEEWAQSSS